MKTNKNNTFSIMKKECKRLFGDSKLVLAGIILPGLVIYIMYMLMGTVMDNLASVDEDYRYKVDAINAPASLPNMLAQSGEAFDISNITETEIETAKAKVNERDTDLLIMFSPNFDEAVAAFDINANTEAPQVQIWYNAGNLESMQADAIVTSILREYERSFAKRFDINALLPAEEYDLNTGMDFGSAIMMSMVPMLFIMVIYQGCMAIAPESIAGEKERGTLGTLLATPAKRTHMALAKILSITIFAVLGAAVSFVGMMLSMPALMTGMDAAAMQSYSLLEFVYIFIIALSTVLVFVSLLSIMSAYAKSTKEATSYATPLMMVSIVLGMSSLFTGGAADGFYFYIIPVFNSAQSLAGIFAGEAIAVNIGITALSNTALALICAGMLARMFSSERIVFDK